MLPEPTFNSYLILGAVLCATGAAGVFLRRNVVSVLASVQVMLAGVVLTFVAADRYLGRIDGQVMAAAIVVVGVCQLVAGLAVALMAVRQRQSLDPDEVSDLRW